MRRFRFELDRDSYRASHVLAPFVLSSCEPVVPPHEWVFVDSSHSRPEISAKCGVRQMRFNISRTRRAVASIVPCNLDCGVDIELTHGCSDLHNLARAALAPAELATIAVGPDAERPTYFCRYWTLKEHTRKRSDSACR